MEKMDHSYSVSLIHHFSNTGLIEGVGKVAEKGCIRQGNESLRCRRARRKGAIHDAANG